jgi:hypothetical protein
MNLAATEANSQQQQKAPLVILPAGLSFGMP